MFVSGYVTVRGPMVFYPINYEHTWPREMDIMIIQRFGEKFEMNVDDGSGFVRSFNSSHFTMLNIRDKCIELRDKNKHYVDKAVCNLFPKSKYNIKEKQ